MRKPDRNGSRFFNFPLCLLAGTFDDPGVALDRILNYAIAVNSKNVRADWKDALAQLAYIKARKVKKPLSKGVEKFCHDEGKRVHDLTIDVEFAFRDSQIYKESFHSVMRKYIGYNYEIPSESAPTQSQQNALVEWWKLTKSAAFFNITLGSCEATWKDAAAVADEVRLHEAQHGSDALATVPRDFFWQTLETARSEQDEHSLLEAMRLFRMVCAVRSIVGKKEIARTVKNMIRARCVGGKTPDVAKTLASDNPLLKAELVALQSRHRFDRILNSGSSRNFYQNAGIGRRINLSIRLQDVKEFAKAASKRRTAMQTNLQKQRDIRAAIAAGSNVASK